MPHDTTKAGPRQEAGPVPNHQMIDQISADSTADGPLVTGHAVLALHREVTTALWPGSPTVRRIIQRAVPAAFREPHPTADGAILVYSSKRRVLLDALHRAGVDVRELGGEHR